MSSSTSENPSNANEGCVGPTSQDAGKASACAGCPNQSACSSGAFSSPGKSAFVSLFCHMNLCVLYEVSTS